MNVFLLGSYHAFIAWVCLSLWHRVGTPHMKVVGMLVVSLRGVDFEFWSHLGCSGQNASIISREGLV